jgi:hypothetical protein
VKVVSVWATVALYVWSLVAPALFPERFGAEPEATDGA